MSVSVGGTLVAVGGFGVYVSVGNGALVSVMVGFGVAVVVIVGTAVGASVFVLVGACVAVQTGVCVSDGPFDFVGGNRKLRNEKGVGLGVDEGPETGISAKLNVLVGTAVIRTARVGGRAIAVGTSSETICSASTAAVLFILAKETSAVLRILISNAVGGVGLNPAIRTIIQTKLAQRNRAAKACNGTR